MFQTIIPDIIEEDFQEVEDLFSSHIFDANNMSSDDSEWDMAATYTPNWACGWNNRDAIGEPCRIISKNSRIAHVVFSNMEVKDVPKTLYRLEDLSKF